MNKIFIAMVSLVLSTGIINSQDKGVNVSTFFKEINTFLKVEGMEPDMIGNQHIRFMRGNKQYNLVAYDANPVIVCMYSDYTNSLPLSDSTSVIITKPEGIRVTFLERTFRLSVDINPMDVESFKYELYRQINLMNQCRVLFRFPDNDSNNEPKLTYDRLKFTRVSNGDADSFVIYCSDGQTIPFNMILVKGGTFEMGDPDGNHQTESVSDFFLCDVEVSRRFWEVVMSYVPVPYRNLKVGMDYPANYISWNDANRFIHRLNSLTGLNFRFPSEKEWEYAAKGGSKTHNYKYSGSDKLQDVAYYVSLSGRPAPLKSKRPNELGFFDMSGNVAEWCDNGLETDKKPVRGGSYVSDNNLCKVYETTEREVDYREASVGLRLALTL